MAVKVTKKMDNPVRTGDVFQHSEGVDINISDGHLIVMAVGPKRLAIYAPGTWAHAEVTK